MAQLTAAPIAAAASPTSSNSASTAPVPASASASAPSLSAIASVSQGGARSGGGHSSVDYMIIAGLGGGKVRSGNADCYSGVSGIMELW
jgi:hypothetical protein